VAHRHSELRSVAEPQQWQSELCRCTRLLQQSLLKVAKSVQAEHRDSELVAIMIEAPKRMPKASITSLLATFVLTHLLVQLGNGHASMLAALVLANNRAYSGSV